MNWHLLFLGIAAYWLLRLTASHFRVLQNRWTASPESYRSVAPLPTTVSVCIPARNEAGVIATCVRSVLQQDSSSLVQVILVDDCSDDETSAIARRAANGDPRFEIVVGAGPPEGWMGKSAACWRAQKEAHGEWLLFVDADVKLHPRALSVALAAAREYNSDMLSWFGQLETHSFWEHVLMPFIGDFIALVSPLARVNDPSRDDSIANGQFILIRRSTYDTVGGHKSIRSSVVDDVSLSRVVKHHKETKLRYTLLHTLGLMEVRMYDSLAAIWRGFSKNFYAASKSQTGIMMIGIGLLLVGSVLPFAALPWLLLGGENQFAGSAALAVASILIFRIYTRRYIPAPGWSLLFHPLAALVTAGIMLNSTLQGLGILRPTEWKGRSVS
jgi:chlorobactene glucosyltransferase